MDLPDDVVDEFGHLLNRIQHGAEDSEPNVKRFNEDARIAHLFKVVTNGEDGNTYRGVATVEFPEGSGSSTSPTRSPRPGSLRRRMTLIASTAGWAG